MQNKYSFIVILLLTFLSGCMFFEKRIDKLYPQESKLTFDTFKRCERIIIDKNYLILQTNAKYETEYYEPYLLFYKKSNLRLEFKLYNPGKIFSVKDSIVVGFYNESRSESQRMKLENGYDFLFDKKEPNNSRNLIQGDISLFTVKADSVLFVLKKDSSIIKYSINQIVFSPLRKNNIEIYDYTKNILTYNHYKVDELELKKSLWKNLITKQ